MELLAPARVTFPYTRFRVWQRAFPGANANASSTDARPWQTRSMYPLDIPLADPQPFDVDLEADRQSVLRDMAVANKTPAAPVCDVRLDIQAAHFSHCSDAFYDRVATFRDFIRRYGAASHGNDDSDGPGPRVVVLLRPEASSFLNKANATAPFFKLHPTGIANLVCALPQLD